MCAGIILCFYAFDLPQFRGVRMAAVVVLFLLFGFASLPLTYLLSFNFSDEMRALQVPLPCTPACLVGLWLITFSPLCLILARNYQCVPPPPPDYSCDLQMS